MKTIIVNKQISLEKIKYTHAFLVFQAIDQNREFLSKWLPFIDQTRTQEDTEAFIRSVLEETEKEKEMVFVIWYQDHFAGLVGLKDTDMLNRKTEIGYWLVESMTGRGIMKQTVGALLQFIFMTMELNRVQIRCAVGNQPSAAIPNGLGFRFEGIERAGEKHKHHFADLEVYSLLRNEWKNLQK